MTMAGVLVSSAAAAATQLSATTTSFVASKATFANPERGLYRHSGDCDKKDFSPATLVGYRATENISLVMCIFYLAEFKAAPISQAQLDRFTRQAAAVRAAGLKMIVRFAYTKSEAGDDATLARITGHLDQLAPYLKANSDVIAVVQSGFVGAWGEGYYTQHFGNNGNVSAVDWTNRKAVVDKLLSVLPSTRMVQVRTPAMKRHLYGTAPVTATSAYNGSSASRVGHHNDCFLASSSDFGTYQDKTVEYPYLQADTAYVVMGGETCALNPPRSDCPTAVQELGGFHYSFLNKDYNQSVLSTWTTGGCMTQVEQRLGYRFEIVGDLFPATVTRGSTLLAQIFVKNSGWSTPFNRRPVYLVMRNTLTHAVTRVALSSDPRRWSAGTTTAIFQNVGIPWTFTPGTYELLLSLPDPATSLASRPEYAIQLATVGVWEPTTGLNRLLSTITVQ